MKVEQLDVHRRPVGEPRSGGVLTESLIIREPNFAGKMAVGPQDQQLVLHEIFPTVREMRGIMFTVGNGDVMSTAMSTAISVDSRSI